MAVVPVYFDHRLAAHHALHDALKICFCIICIIRYIRFRYSKLTHLLTYSLTHSLTHSLGIYNK